MWLNSLRQKKNLAVTTTKTTWHEFYCYSQDPFDLKQHQFLQDSERSRFTKTQRRVYCYKLKLSLYYTNKNMSLLPELEDPAAQQSNLTTTKPPLQNSGAVVSCHWLGPFSYMQLNGILCYYLFLYTCLCFAWKNISKIYICSVHLAKFIKQSFYEIIVTISYLSPVFWRQVEAWP